MVSELPPRARRIRLTTDCMQYSMGTTSACAENTQRIARFAINKRNYLRVRGEYATPPPCETRHTELPPRARRIPAPITFCENQCGTTSACAENTSGVYQNILRNRNYLRVRGEYATSPFLSWYSWELPPRARRIPRCLKIMALAVGTTSACAENTAGVVCGGEATWNYLRVRGEYVTAFKASISNEELPPRARRIPDNYDIMIVSAGTTSACAENTATDGEFPHATRNYLRVRGEYELNSGQAESNL